MQNVPEISLSHPPPQTDIVVVKPSTLRFAVGTFDTWQQLGQALQDLQFRGFPLNSFNCLACKPLFAGELIIQFGSIEELAFPSGELLGCTPGPFADCLVTRLRAGASSLKDALGSWLVPRHAAHFQIAIESGKILLWVQLSHLDDERRACLSLLTSSSNSVAVHDV